MARPKKTEELAVISNGVHPSANPHTITMEEAIFMRDKFMSGLISLESGVTELRKAYVSHFNTLLPPGHHARLALPFFQTSYDGATEAGPAQVLRAGTPAVPTVEGGAKRKRKPHDPNAPKRALTSYFLFMAENKPAIKELNPDWTAAQISEESERRWQNITPEKKAEFDLRYQIDLCRYYKQKEAYEAGQPIPQIDADEAKALYEEQLRSGQPPKGRKTGKKVTAANAPAETGDAHSPESTSEEEEEEEEEEAPAPPPVPERGSKRQRTNKENEASAKAAPKKAAEKPKPSIESPVVEAVTKSPEKKKKGSKKKGEKAAEEPEVEASSPVEKKEKKSRKRKSGAE